MEEANGSMHEEGNDDDLEIGNSSGDFVANGPVNKKLSFLDLYKIKPNQVRKEYPIKETLLLAFQTLGIVYGDIGTSPLYTFSSITLSNAGENDILGILSLIFWTLSLIGVVKYVFIVLRADDHGEGGTFALYSFLCRHIKFKNSMTIQNTRLGSDLNLKYYSKRSGLQSKTKEFLENSPTAQTILTLVVLLGTCMVIGDGALTPAISVLSAAQGIQSRSPKITTNHVIILTVIILLLIFLFQRAGTSKISFTYSPIMLIWLLSTATIGLYNIITYYPEVFKALSPHYIYIFFARNHETGWKLLGAVAMCITGAEAMFADLGHFNKRSIQVAFTCLVYPALILTYAGEAAYLIKHPDQMSTAFYSSVPSPVFWPMFIIATLAAVVGSQCLISASFSIIKQSMALGCFPRVTMIHTSDNYEGQVYSPEVNYFLMVLCILIVIGFQGGAQIGNAYGVAVIWVMLITTCLMTVVMLVIWDTHILLIIGFLAVFLTVEVGYMTSLLNKVPQGGWVPLAISCLFLLITLSWTYGRKKKNEYEIEKQMSLDDLNELVSASNSFYIPRVPGICFFCTDLVKGIPPIIRHYVQHAGSLRQVLVIVTVRTLPIKSVLPEERFVVAPMGPPGVYRCLVQYGYKDVPSMEGHGYVEAVLERLKDVVAEAVGGAPCEIDSAMEKGGVVFVMGRTIIKAKESNGWLSRFVINYLYSFLKNNCKSTLSSLRVPPGQFLQVGMLEEI